MNEAIFTIKKSNGRFDFTCKRYPNYNRYGVMFIEIFKTMHELSEEICNEIGVGVLFEID